MPPLLLIPPPRISRTHTRVHSPLWSPQANVILETKVKQENENEKLLAKRARKFKAENTSKYINYISFISIFFFWLGAAYRSPKLV